MTKSLVIEVVASTPEAVQETINAALTDLALPADNYLDCLTIAYKEKNQTAMIIIFYNDDGL